MEDENVNEVIDDMLENLGIEADFNSGDGEDVGTEVTSDTEPQTTEPTTTKTSEVSESSSTPPEPVTKEESSQVIEPDIDSLEDYQQRNKILMERIEELTRAGIPQSQFQVPSLDVSRGITTPVVTTPPKQYAQQQVGKFLSNTTIEEIVDNPEKFEEILQSVYDRALRDATSRASEHVMKNIPNLVLHYAGYQQNMTRQVEDFYKNNPDLAEVKNTVAHVVNQIYSENPNLSVADTFKEAATRSRKILGLREQATNPRVGSPLKPNNPSISRGRTTNPREKMLEGVAKDVANLIS